MTLRRTLSAALLGALLVAGCSSPDSTDEVDPTTSAAGTAAPAQDPTTTGATEPGGETTGPETDEPVEQTAEATVEPGEETTAPELVGDEAERYGLVVPSFHAYWDVINQTYAEGGAEQPTEDMLNVMTGQQLDFWARTFADWKAAGNTYEGVNRVLYANPQQVALTETGGTAEVDFCVDMTATKAFDADGEPLTKGPGFQSGVAVLTWMDGHWKVAGHREGTANQDQC